jgi:hypothetical protein
MSVIIHEMFSVGEIYHYVGADYIQIHRLPFSVNPTVNDEDIVQYLMNDAVFQLIEIVGIEDRMLNGGAPSYDIKIFTGNEQLGWITFLKEDADVEIEHLTSLDEMSGA